MHLGNGAKCGAALAGACCWRTLRKVFDVFEDQKPRVTELLRGGEVKLIS